MGAAGKLAATEILKDWGQVPLRMTRADILVVGAGHNGLVTAAYLAKAGRRVLVLERAGAPGGQLAAAFRPAPRRPRCIRRGSCGRTSSATSVWLGMACGPPLGQRPACVLVCRTAGRWARVRGRRRSTLDAIRRLSARDAARWPEFLAFMDGAAGFLDAAYRTPMPRLQKSDLVADGLPLAWLALGCGGSGARTCSG